MGYVRTFVTYLYCLSFIVSLNYVHVEGCIFMFHCRGLVPLHNACSYGHFEVTELLLKVPL